MILTTTCRGCGVSFDYERRPGRAREWCSERCRKFCTYAEPCEDCGRPHGGRANSKRGHVQRWCADCARRHAGEQVALMSAAMRAEIELLWAEDMPIAQIAAEMGFQDRNTMGAFVVRMRREGANLPYRYEITDEGREAQRRAGRQAARRLHGASR